MSEIAEQIQNSILTELPAPSLPEVPPQAPAPDVPQPDGASPDEADLSAEITELWRLHSDYKGSIKSQTENLRSLRAELGKRLSEMKQLLARPGRSGEWSGWLKKRGISRATADRLVLKYERSVNPDENCLSESISEPSEEQIQNLFDKLAPKLRRALRTPMSVFRFLDLLTSSLEGVDRRVTEEGFTVLTPSSPNAHVGEVKSADAQVAPVPVIAEVLPEGNVQSTGTSMAL